MKLGIVPDMHMQEKLGYADYIEDGRNLERKMILDFIVASLSDCDSIIFMGDQFHSRNNTSKVIKEFVQFLGRFEGKKIYMLAGNHDKTGDGKSAIDFLKEIKNKPNWFIVTDEIYTQGSLTFCPYFTKAELNAKNDKEGIVKIMGSLKGGNILFHHFAMSDTKTISGIDTNLFHEVVLPCKELENRYNLVVGGHIHSPHKYGKSIVSGSVFNNEVGEIEKFIWKIDADTFDIEQIKLPGRGIYGLENPILEELNALPKDSIVKVTLTDANRKDDVQEIKECLKRFDAYLLLEKYPNQREKLHFDDGMLEFPVEKLLEVYASEKKVDINKLKFAWELIK